MDRLKQNVDISYYSISSAPYEEDEEPLRPPVTHVELGDHPQLARPRSWATTFLVQLASALWLAPITYLLYLNLTGHVIGASAWCPNGKCWLDAFNPLPGVALNNTARFNRNDHNLLGGLQLVAKGLEIWFIAIVAALVYLVTMRLAAKPGGLPIGYLTRPTEFAEFLNLFDPLLWSSTKGSDKRVSHRAWFLIVISVILCLLCNLMGPATAVLAIPSLQWIDTEYVGTRRFEELNAAKAPGIDPNSAFRKEAAYLCTESQLLAHNYSCILDTSGHAMDAWLESCLSSHGNLGYTQAIDLTFGVNDTLHSSSTVATQENFTDFVFWVPSRQTLANLTNDKSVITTLSNGLNVSYTKYLANNLSLPTDPIETYVRYNKSLALNLQRLGPIAGFIPTSWVGVQNSVNQTLPWTVSVGKDKWIRCYMAYIPGWTPVAVSIANLVEFSIYTKCNRMGSGWSPLNKAASFYLPLELSATSLTTKKEQLSALGVQVDIYSSDRSVFFPNGTFPDWLPPTCLAAGNVSKTLNCDYDRLFSEPAPPRVANRVRNVNTIEMYISDGTNEAILASDFVAFSNFTTYSLDVSPISNPLGYVRAEYLPEGDPSSDMSIHVDPNWILAAWSVEDGGFIQLGRPSASIVFEVMTSLFNYGFSATWMMAASWNKINLMDYVAFIPIAHALSLIDYKTGVVSDDAQPDSDHPLLFRTAHMYVWGYFMASRTAIMGVAVTIFGCIVVLMQLFLGFKDRRRYRSPTQLLVAALEHTPRGEFEGRRHNEKIMARVPFHIDEHDIYGLKFSHAGNSSGPTRDSSNQTVFSPGQASGGFSPWQGGYSPGQSRYTSLSGGFAPWQGSGTMSGDAYTRDFTS